jgi:hypothetical protein
LWPVLSSGVLMFRLGRHCNNDELPPRSARAAVRQRLSNRCGWAGHPRINRPTGDRSGWSDPNSDCQTYCPSTVMATAVTIPFEVHRLERAMSAMGTPRRATPDQCVTASKPESSLGSREIVIIVLLLIISGTLAGIGVPSAAVGQIVAAACLVAPGLVRRGASPAAS